MTLPFDATQFFDVFSQYNQRVWPAQIFLLLLALVAIGLAVWRRPSSGRAIMAILALLWLWIGVVYHLGFFRSINPAAVFFGAAFMAQAVLLVFVGLRPRSLQFRLDMTVRGITAVALLVYAFVAYPLIGYAAGHRYPAVPTFGLPCPTTIFTLAMLLMAQPRAPTVLLLVPIGWSMLGVAAAVQLGVWQDLGLLVAGVLTALLTYAKTPSRNYPGHVTRPV
jgi:hypothetical protein